VQIRSDWDRRARVHARERPDSQEGPSDPGWEEGTVLRACEIDNEPWKTPPLQMPKQIERSGNTSVPQNKIAGRRRARVSQVSIIEINQCGVVLPPVLEEGELEPCGVVEGCVLPGAVVPGVVVFGVPFGEVWPGVVVPFGDVDPGVVVFGVPFGAVEPGVVAPGLICTSDACRVSEFRSHVIPALL